MRKILDTIFSNIKLCLRIPVFSAALVYLLFVIFSNVQDKTKAVIAIPVLSAVWFFGVYFVLLCQIKNKYCPASFLDIFELLIIVFFSLFSVMGIVKFILSGFNDLEYGVCLGIVTYSAVSWAHSKRVK